MIQVYFVFDTSTSVFETFLDMYVACNMENVWNILKINI